LAIGHLLSFSRLALSAESMAALFGLAGLNNESFLAAKNRSNSQRLPKNEQRT
jgi:hypothetical protein